MTSGVNMSSRIAVVIFLLPSQITVTSRETGRPRPKVTSPAQAPAFAGEPRDLVEVVYPGGIASGDLGLLLFGAARQNLLNDLVTPGEGGLDMWVIRAPEEIVDTDDIAVAYPHRIFLEARKHIAVEIVAGQRGFLKPIALLLDALGVGVVDTVEEMRNPGQFVLHGADLEFWIALKDAAEDHVSKRHPHPVVGVGQEGVADAVAVLEPKILAWARPVGRDVHAKRNIQILGRRPQRLVHRIVVPFPLGGINGDHTARQPDLGTALQLLDTLLRIVHVDHGDALKALGLPGAKLGEPVVVSSKNLRQQRTVWHAVEQQTDCGIDNTHIHVIGIHILEVLRRLVAAAPDFIEGRGADHLFGRLKPHACLAPGGQTDHAVTVAEPPIAIILAHKLWDPVLESRLGSARPQIRWLKHVIVRRYDPVIRHDGPLLPSGERPHNPASK